MARIHAGTVLAFDAERGLGEVSDDDGGVLGFHCTAIADGSRWIAVGTAVHFLAIDGHAGRREAADLVAIDVGGFADDDSER